MLRLFQKLGKKAQSTFEYTIIVTVVAASIIIIGPYVIRSWNAYLKSTEASLLDSFGDPLEEAPQDIVDLPDCTCGDAWIHTTCGDAFDEIHCSIFEMGSYLECTGPYRVCREKYGEVFRCVTDERCCTEWSRGPCGVNATPPCHDGERQWARECGSPGNWKYDCRDEHACHFQCEMAGDWPAPGTYERCGRPADEGGYDLEDESGLPDDTNYTFVDDGGCNTDIKCEIECQDPFVARGNGCGCPTGQVWQGECTEEDQCEQGICSDGQCQR